MPTHTPLFNHARLIEVFSAIQGEGLNVGTRQIFIRFALCDLRCQFCDSAHTWSAPETCRVERTPGLRDFETEVSPVPLSVLLEWVERQNLPGLHDSISLTGGEPLLHAPFLAEFLPQLRASTGLPIYLETGGHRPEQLAMILPYLDSVGMDLKLPSVSGENRWQEHAEFLQRCYRASVEVFVKVIISSQTHPEDLERAAELVADVHPSIPVFLQPVTPLEGAGSGEQREVRAEVSSDRNFARERAGGEETTGFVAPCPEQVLTWQAQMKRSLLHVRVVPQTHKMLNQL